MSSALLWFLISLGILLFLGGAVKVIFWEGFDSYYG